jgi:hypothetical protein
MPSARRNSIILAVVFVPVALMTGCWVNDSILTHAFYEAHPLLKEIDLAVTGIDPRKNNPLAVRRSIVLKSMPIETPRPEAVRLLTAAHST